MTSRRRLRSRHPATGQPAPARRVRRPRAADVRLWAGLGLVLVSMVGGAALLSRSDDTVVVWQASQDLAVGSSAVAVPVQVALGDASDAYLPASQPLDGTVLAAVSAGSLIPRSAVGAAPPADARFVTVAVDPLHAPVGLASGDVVDVWTTPADAVGTAAAVPARVIADALVADVSYDDLGIGGQVPVVLQIDASQAEALIAATRGGVVDLVAVPLASQGRTMAATGTTADAVVSSPQPSFESTTKPPTSTDASASGPSDASMSTKTTRPSAATRRPVDDNARASGPGQIATARKPGAGNATAPRTRTKPSAAAKPVPIDDVLVMP